MHKHIKSDMLMGTMLAPSENGKNQRAIVGRLFFLGYFPGLRRRAKSPGTGFFIGGDVEKIIGIGLILIGLVAAVIFFIGTLAGGHYPLYQWLILLIYPGIMIGLND